MILALKGSIGCVLWLVSYVVTLPVGDGLQPSHQGLHEVHHVLTPLKSGSESDFIDKFNDTCF
jgi:hypothetical protein